MDRKRTKQEVCETFLQQLIERGDVDLTPADMEGIRKHFATLPSRYALDVNLASMDVLNHRMLMESARNDPSAVSFQVRPVDVVPAIAGLDGARRPSFAGSENMYSESGSHASPARFTTQRSLPRPAFGSSPNLQALVLESEDRRANSDRAGSSQPTPSSIFYEVTIASIDQPKLLSRLSEALGDLNLNICEAHAFNSTDKFSLDVFVVNGWTSGSTEDLEEVLSRRLQELPPPPVQASPSGSRELPEQRLPPDDAETLPDRVASSSGAPDDWELDPGELLFHEKIASGAFGDLFRGTYCGQEVAIKILRNVHDDSQQYQEFLQEVAIMRKVRHKNVVQFIGACTKKPNLCIVFEFMPGGSVYEYIRRTGPLRVAHVLKVAVEVCRGMDYLHKRKIVHRDLKAANLLLDEGGTVKIADFGVARVMDGGGVMTAETGTYRWMAPEVIEHNPYREKADVFSFGVVIWELLTGKVPYADMTPLQAAVGVVQKGLRPPIPPTCPPALADIMRQCWQRDPAARPGFELLKRSMEELLEVYKQQDAKKPQSGGLFAKLRGSNPPKSSK